MKVRDVIKTLEQMAGIWIEPEGAIDSLSIRKNLAW